MKSPLKSTVAALVLICACASTKAATVGVDPGASWQGYMNVFNLPQAGGAYQFGSAWAVADLRATWAGPVLTLSPNTIGDPNPYWYTPSGGPGAVGNKIMDAQMYVETTGVYSGQTLTFAGEVLSNTLVGHYDANKNGWTSVAFIKDYAPDYSSSTSVTVPLVNGQFSLALGLDPNPARHVQWGFETIGPDVWITDVERYGSIRVAAASTVPEPAAFVINAALLLPFGIGFTRKFRKA